MFIAIQIVFWLCVFLIFWANIGYGLSLKVLSRIFKKRQLKKDYEHLPTVTVMVVAHNEEKVIGQKLENLLELDYPREKLRLLVSSDNSTDATNSIVEEFIKAHPDTDLTLYCVKERKGKTNAQNEAQRTVTTEFLVMTDANAMLDKNCVKELMAAFASQDVSYVSGRLAYVNSGDAATASSESGYWSSDLKLREIESRIQTITAGNGAIYACRNSEYIYLDPIRCHDGNMPMHYAIHGKKALYNKDAVAFEKAGEVDKDEYKRKVRMSRGIIRAILPDIRILNVFRCKWYSYFYFGHRTCRYMLWLNHLLAYALNACLVLNPIYLVLFVCQNLFYFCAILQLIFKTKNKYLRLVFYYCMTVVAQWNGVYNILTGKAKPFWEKAETTR